MVLEGQKRPVKRKSAFCFLQNADGLGCFNTYLAAVAIFPIAAFFALENAGQKLPQ